MKEKKKIEIELIYADPKVIYLEIYKEYRILLKDDCLIYTLISL